MEPEVVKVEVVGDNIDIRYSDGSRERIEFGVYELRDSDGKRIERHRATDDDYARLQSIVDEWDGDTTSDDGTPDQGSGDAPGTPGADDSLTPGSDDGTPDQGSGDAPGTPGADDNPTPGSDDGTPDQGSGDAGTTSTSSFGDSGGGVAGVRIRGNGSDEEITGTDGDDRLEGRGGDDVMHGGAGNDRVDGGRGNDIVNGGSGNDDLWGDTGADTFVFSDGGQDKIHDFQVGIDKIDVSAHGFADAAEVLANAWQDGLDTFVDLGGGDLIKIDDVALASLSESDFIV